jgi:hypothetical protein
MKKILWIIGGILILAIASGASFEGGMAYQRNQADSIRSQFLRSRGINTTNGTGTNANRSGGFGFGGGGGATGQIKSIQGNTIELSTPTNVTTVTLTASTQIEKSISAKTSDLQTGEQLIVRGQRDANGNITADNIQIMSTTGSASQGASAP